MEENAVRRRVHRKSEVEQLCSVLEEQAGHRMSESRLLAELQARYRGWDEEKLSRRVVEAVATCEVARVAGRGRILRYSGNERSGSGGIPDLYATAARVLTEHWLPGCRCRQPEVLYTARAGAEGKTWVAPDLVGRCNPRSADGNLLDQTLHTFEVETVKGFSLRSVYQAHAEGLGADYSWVLFNRGGAAGHSDGERIEWVAKKLGIGLVNFTNSNSVDTWDVICSARRRTPWKPQREQLEELLEKALLL